MFRKIRHSHFIICLLWLALATGFVRAQETKSLQSPSVTAAAAGGRVRFAAPGEVVQLRLEVFAAGGEKLFDSDFRAGNLLDWPVEDQQGQRLADGDYLCLVTVKALSGEVRLQHGLLRLESGEAALRPVEQEPLSAAQAGALEGSRQSFATGSVERSTPFRILSAGEALTTTVMAADGSAGQVTTSAAGLSIRAGDFFGRNDEVQLLLTPEGNLGVGVARPEARLDVAGLIRTSKGIVFPDGTIQTTAANAPVSAARDRQTALDNPTGSAIRDRLSPGRTVQAGSEQKEKAGKGIPGPNQVNITAGTANRLAKYAADGATLVDSIVTESPTGDIGIGTASPGGVFDLQRSSAGDILQRLWNTGGGGAKLRYVAATGATSQLQLTDGLEWLSAIVGNNSIGLQFRVRDVGTPNSEAQLNASARLTILRDGKVGIGTTTPFAKLEVVGGNNIGVFGNTSSGVGVVGGSLSGTGVLGQTFAANTTTLAGVRGVSEGDGGIGVFGEANTGYAWGVYGKSTSAIGEAGHFEGKVVVVGKVLATDTVCAANIACASDARLKQHVTSLNYGLQHLLQLRPVSWQWKDPSMKQLPLGLIAQEVEGVIPELILREADPARPLGLNYLGLVPVVIKAIQEQQTALEQKEAAINSIKAENAALKAQNQIIQQRNAELDARLTALEQIVRQLKATAETPRPPNH
ncbi:MAG TPA: tail fiber domain-containing protein [Blastocatellia bacterium]|nr:tail fiber domain-containing protein [Blastocatellia bacterium]